ncbi:MAG: NAD-dependent epimerase/dehydratase family protein [Myxococcota bacterium]
MRYLVTGATTPLAVEVIRALLAEPETETVLGVANEARRSMPIRDGRLRYLRFDLTRERSIRSLMFGPVREVGVQCIVHLAVHRKIRHGKKARALHVDAPQRVLRFTERVPSVEQFVYCSSALVYDVDAHLPVQVDEEHPLRIGSGVPPHVLDRVAADLAVCGRMGMSRVRIAVLRPAECLAEDMGSQLLDYLQSRVCFRPVGFDPMVNLISVEDLGRALAHAAIRRAQGVFTIPGLDALPLSCVIRRFGRREVPIPGPLLRPLYGIRRRVTGADFRYGMHHRQFHFGGVLDGRRAREAFGYEPRVPVRWPLRLDEVGKRAQRQNTRTLRGVLARVSDTAI